MSSFNPPAFPPPTLADVPVEYIIDQLRNMAPYYWTKPETADCTIIVPIPHVKGRRPMSSTCSPPKFRHSIDFHPSAGGRVTESSLNSVPHLTFKIHMDYLSASSSYLRALFSGACPMDLINSQSSAPASSPDLTRHYSVPPNRLPKLLSSVHDHPILYLPVPDPTSLHLLIHWMYFGDINVISEALHESSIQWEGIARNAEYLGLPAELKLFLSRWYHTWLDPAEVIDDDDDDDDDYESDSETECSDMDDSSSTAGDMDDCHDVLQKDDATRGRNVIARPLSFQPAIPPSAV